MAVARFESMPLMPSFARIEVNAANTADSIAYTTHRELDVPFIINPSSFLFFQLVGSAGFFYLRLDSTNNSQICTG